MNADEDVIKLARAVCEEVGSEGYSVQFVRAFANRVRAAALEEAAKVAETTMIEPARDMLEVACTEAAGAIRALAAVAPPGETK